MSYTVQNYRTLGEAWSGAWSWMLSQVFPNAATLSAVNFSYVPTAGAVAGYIQLDTSPATWSAQFYVQESLGGRVQPLRYIISQPGLQGPWVYNANLPSGNPVAINVLASNMIAALNASMTYQSPGGFETLYSYGYQPSGYAGALSWFYFYLGIQGNDCVWGASVWVNEYFADSVWGVGMPIGPTYPPGYPVPSLQSPVQVIQTQPQDQDISLNNGQAIYSVTSGTITMIPP